MAKKGHKDLYPKIISMAEKGTKGVDIAAELGLSPNSVRTILFNNGVKLKTPRGRPMVDNPVRNRFKVPKVHKGPEQVMPDPFMRVLNKDV
jgi:vacuolar-type H+-ATPase subunit E/Vma4